MTLQEKAQHKDIPDTLNLVLGGLILVIIGLQMFVLPVLLQDKPGWLLILILLGLPFNTPFWSLIHEAIHRNFHSHKTINEYGGRLMAVIFGASFSILRFGHLMHHRFNRGWESEFCEKKTAGAYINHYFKMLGGLYLIEVLTSFLIALCPRSLTAKLCTKLFPEPQHYQAVENALLKPEALRKMRIDCVLVIALYAASFILYAQNWPLLVAMIAGRALLISLMDNAYHYGTPLDNSIAAKELQVPSWMAHFILNFNHHLTHHNNTRLPWTKLAEGRTAQNNHYAEKLLSALLRQFKGPLTPDAPENTPATKH